MKNLLFGLYILGAALVVWALVEAARTGSLRWSLTIIVLPVVGAIAWFVTGRGLYKNDA